MFERFTERARQVIVLAQEEARDLKHNYIGTEHLLLGLLAEEEGIACRVLYDLDIKIEYVRGQLVRIVGSGTEVTTGQIPFTPRAKKVCELALREALSLGHNYIGTEHLLLGLVRENEGVATRILDEHGATAQVVRDAVIRALQGPRKPKPQPAWDNTDPTNPLESASAEDVLKEILRRIKKNQPDVIAKAQRALNAALSEWSDGSD